MCVSYRVLFCLQFHWSRQSLVFYLDVTSGWRLTLMLLGFFLSLSLWLYWLCLCLLLYREPDIPAWAPLLYQLQLLDIRDKPDPLTLPIADRIRIGNQKREQGNFHFQREEYSKAARAYCMALDVLTTRSRGNPALYVEFIHRKCWLSAIPGNLFGEGENGNPTQVSVWTCIYNTHTCTRHIKHIGRHISTSVSAQNDITAERSARLMTLSQCSATYIWAESHDKCFCLILLDNQSQSTLILFPPS